MRNVDGECTSMHVTRFISVEFIPGFYTGMTHTGSRLKAALLSSEQQNSEAARGNLLVVIKSLGMLVHITVGDGTDLPFEG